MMVTEYYTKKRVRISDIRKVTPESMNVENVLAKLVKQRVVRVFSEGEYELIHDFLASKVIEYVKEKRFLSLPVRLALEFIDNNYHRHDVKCGEISAASGVSQPHLSSLFREQLGVTVMEKLSFTRVANAKLLLGESRDKLTTVADATGFRRQSSLSKKFKELEGCSPIQYRNEQIRLNGHNSISRIERNGTSMNRIRILFLAANPRGSQLHLDKECREITSKIRAAEFRDSIDLVTRWAVRPDDLQQALLEVRPNIVHFSGHGETNGIVLLGDDDTEKLVSTEAVEKLFSILKSEISLVVLNSCFSRSQATAIAAHVGCAIGMQRTVDDAAAILFASSLYRALGFGRSVSQSFHLAKSSLELEGLAAHDIPELVVAHGVNADQIILQSGNTKQGT